MTERRSTSRRACACSATDGGFWACGKATRRPVHLASYTGPYGSFKVLGRRSGKVIFVFEFSGEGGGEDTSVGWFDGKRARSGQLAGRVSNDVLDVVVAANGGIGVVSSLGEDAGVRAGYLAPRRDELVLATVGGRYARRSLAFTTGGLRWRRGRADAHRPADGRTAVVHGRHDPARARGRAAVRSVQGATVTGSPRACRGTPRRASWRPRRSATRTPGTSTRSSAPARAWRSSPTTASGSSTD